MNKLIVLFALAVGCGYSQNPQQLSNVGSIQWVSAVPSGPTSISANVVGSTGPAQLYYWVIANFSGGNAIPSKSAMVNNGPNVLNSTNYVTITWNSVTGATSYDVLKSTNANFPGSGQNALIVNTTALTVNDTGQSLTNYTVNTLTSKSCTWYVDGTTSNVATVNTPCINVPGIANVNTFGLIGDGVINNDGVTVANQNTFTKSSGVPFGPESVGKIIDIVGAGAVVPITISNCLNTSPVYCTYSGTNLTREEKIDILTAGNGWNSFIGQWTVQPDTPTTFEINFNASTLPAFTSVTAQTGNTLVTSIIQVTGANSAVLADNAGRSMSGARYVYGTDNSPMAKNMMVQLLAHAQTLGNTVYLAIPEIFFPNGIYMLTAPDSFSNMTNRLLAGLNLTGSGIENTTLVYANPLTTSSDYLINTAVNASPSRYPINDISISGMYIWGLTGHERFLNLSNFAANHIGSQGPYQISYDYFDNFDVCIHSEGDANTDKFTMLGGKVHDTGSATSTWMLTDNNQALAYEFTNVQFEGITTGSYFLQSAGGSFTWTGGSIVLGAGTTWANPIWFWYDSPYNSSSSGSGWSNSQFGAFNPYLEQFGRSELIHSTLRGTTGGNPYVSYMNFHLSGGQLMGTVGVITKPISCVASAVGGPTTCTSANHNQLTGDRIIIGAITNTPSSSWSSITGAQTITVVDQNTFTIPVDTNGDGTFPSSIIYSWKPYAIVLDGSGRVLVDGSARYRLMANLISYSTSIASQAIPYLEVTGSQLMDFQPYDLTNFTNNAPTIPATFGKAFFHDNAYAIFTGIPSGSSPALDMNVFLNFSTVTRSNVANYMAIGALSNTSGQLPFEATQTYQLPRGSELFKIQIEHDAVVGDNGSHQYYVFNADYSRLLCSINVTGVQKLTSTCDVSPPLVITNEADRMINLFSTDGTATIQYGRVRLWHF